MPISQNRSRILAPVCQRAFSRRAAAPNGPSFARSFHHCCFRGDLRLFLLPCPANRLEVCRSPVLRDRGYSDSFLPHRAIDPSEPIQLASDSRILHGSGEPTGSRACVSSARFIDRLRFPARRRHSTRHFDMDLRHRCDCECEGKAATRPLIACYPPGPRQDRQPTQVSGRDRLRYFPAHHDLQLITSLLDRGIWRGECYGNHGR